VAVEEKKSLPSNENRTTHRRQTGFRLHYFPDIPVDGQVGVRRCSPPEDNFQRSHYDSSDAACSESASGIDGPDHLYKKRRLTADEREVQAYQKGFTDGKAEGLVEGQNKGFEQGAQKIKPLLSSVEEALIQLNKIREETYEQIEKEVVELALAIAQKVICHEITTDRETVVCVAREALAKVDDPGKIKIKMSPADLQFINETKDQLSNLISDIDNVTLEAEDSIQSGGCVIETDLGEIDARIEKQLQAVEESFRSTMEKSNTLDPNAG
jgi:flagellar biosynthesis/type III secretory pathway protein FliH